MRTFTISIILIILSVFDVVAQTGPNKYWIQFTDKNNTPYSINNPSEFLSNRAIQRRLTQNIVIKENDLPVDPAYIAGVEALGVTVLTRSKWFNAVTIHTYDPNLIVQLQALPYVQSLQKVATLATQNNDGLNLYRDFMHSPTKYAAAFYNYGFGDNQIKMINGHVLHEQGYTGEGKVIAVLDAGFRNADTLPVFDHLWDNKQILGFRDFVAGDSTVFEDHPHGMNVLSVMGANLSGELVGTAPGASYWLLRSEQTGSENLVEEDNWVAAAEFADSVGADIINSSLGYTTFDNSALSHSYTDLDGNTTRITQGADIAASKGMLVVNSAGNSGNDPWHYIGAPADGDSVLTVGAVNEYEQYASFSSTGPTADGRIKPNVTAQGSPAAVQSTNGSITFGNGTSFSAPIIAGMAACLWQAHPSMTNMQLLEAIEQSGHKYMNPDSLMGYGIPDFSQATTILSNIELEQKNTIAVSPNPFVDHFNVELYYVDSQSVRVELFDATGRQSDVMSLSNSLGNYCVFDISDLGHLPKGLYVLRVIIGDRIQTKKLIKN